MAMEIDASELADGFKAISRETARNAANKAFSTSNESLLEAGDELEYEVFPIAQSAVAPQWEGGGWVFGWVHRASRYLNAGTVDHEIEPVNADVLAFPWPEAPADVRAMYENTFPLVFMPKTEVSGLPAIRFFEDGRHAAERYLEDQ